MFFHLTDDMSVRLDFGYATAGDNRLCSIAQHADGGFDDIQSLTGAMGSDL